MYFRNLIVRPYIGLFILGLSAWYCTSQTANIPLEAPLENPSAKPKKVSCDDESLCTREYIPTTCRFQGQSFEASNHCETLKLVRHFACDKNLVYDETKVECETKEISEEKDK